MEGDQGEDIKDHVDFSSVRSTSSAPARYFKRHPRIRGAHQPEFLGSAVPNCSVQREQEECGIQKIVMVVFVLTGGGGGGGGGGGYEVTCMLKLYFVFFDDQQIANEVITPYWISQNDTTVVMEAVTDGSGTIYIMRVDFEGSGIIMIIFYYYLLLSFLHPLLLSIFDVMQKENPTKVR